MAGSTEIETHKAAKRHRCDWCGEHIESGDTYRRWRYFGDCISTVRVHPECHEAMHEMASEWGDDEEWPLHSNPRGCWCGFDSWCERCKTRRALLPSSERPDVVNEVISHV